MHIPGAFVLFVITLTLGFALGTGLSAVSWFRNVVPWWTADYLACADIDSFVEHMARVPDYRYRQLMFEIHRYETVGAVNELYDRAHCPPATKTANGRITYKTIRPEIIRDTP